MIFHASPERPTAASSDHPTAARRRAPRGAVRVERAVGVLVALVATVVATHLLLGLWPDDGAAFGPVRELLHVDREESLPTWIATGILAACGLAAVRLALREALPFPGWIGLAVVFLAASADEVATFHEAFIDPVKTALGLSGWLRFAWVVPGAIVALVTALLFVRMMLALPPRVRRGLALGAGLFLLGALGFEMVGAKIRDEIGLVNLPYHLIVTTEESLEFAGALTWLGVLLRRLRDLEGGRARPLGRSAGAPRAGAHPEGERPPLR